MMSVVIVYMLVALAMLGLLAAPVYLVRFAHRSRRAQFWQSQEDNGGEVRYRSPYVYARRSVEEPRPRPAAQSRAAWDDAPDNESTPALAGFGAG